MSDHLTRKFSSGRWLCTMAAASVFTGLAFAKFFTPEQVLDLVKMVFIFYFAQRIAETQPEVKP